MNRFTADFSSSTNSAPAEDTPLRRKHLFSSVPELASTTPLVPPPSTLFGSSRFGTGVSTLQFSKNSISSSAAPTPPTHRQPLVGLKDQTPGRPKSRPFHSSFNTSAGDGWGEDGEEEYSDEDMDETDNQNLPSRSQFLDVTSRETSAPLLMKFSAFSNQPSPKPASKKSFRPSKLSQLPRKGNPTVIPRLARDLGSRASPAPLEKDDEVILKTEQILENLDSESQSIRDDAEFQQTVTAHVHEMILQWQKHIPPEPLAGETTSIGPPPSADPFTKANYLASLLLALYHPPISDRLSTRSIPTPQIILDWLDNYHVSYDHLYRTVASASPNVTSHELFWDAVQSLTLRGRLEEVLRLLAEADFKDAASAVDDGGDGPGYHGSQLQTVQSVIYRARQVLNTCPAFQAGNWDTGSVEWDIFRRQLETELGSLTAIAADTGDDEGFQAENFGLRRTNLSLLGRSGQRQTAKLPWTVFQGLKVVFSILMGSTEEIIAQSQDWLEASSALTVWWDGAGDSSVAQWSFDVSQNDQTPRSAPLADPYLIRFRDAVLCVTDPDDKSSFPINALSPIEVGLGSILQGDVETALIILRILSQCVASAVAELGSWAGWLTNTDRSRIPDLTEADLMVLSYGTAKAGITKDDILLGYADALFERGQLRNANGEIVEGWELSISLATRLDDAELTRTTVGDFLNQLDVSDQARAEKVINLCSDLGLQEEAQKVSERFGDHLVNNTAEYGTALLCYARAHTSHKIRQLIDLLISYCLVQSVAYPSEDEMDQSLRGLVGSPKTAFLDIAEIDPDAAQTLQFYMVGYACLRKFYQLRDEEVFATKVGSAPALRPFARRRAAARALVAAINSAADTIYGGLYDAERESAIQVDGLLSLLGEATALLTQNGENRTYTLEQMYDLLAAIEHLQTVGGRVYQAAEECLQASLRNYNGSLPPSPHAMLKKSMSSGTNSNFSFSMMGSEMLARSGESGGGKSVGSAVLVAGPGRGRTARGWDWREKFDKADSNGEQVLRYLRTGIARELSEAEL